MTNGEAIKKINAIMDAWGQDGLYNAEFESALELAIDALETRTPKLPYFEYGVWHCKSCGLDVFVGDFYCPVCGQAIEWEDGD